MMSKTLKNTLFEIAEYLEGLKGSTLTVKEIITRTVDSSFDRHLSTTSQLTLLLENSLWAISGGRLILLGKHSQSYEICFDLVSTAQFSPPLIILVEQYTPRFHRHTELKIEKGSPI